MYLKISKTQSMALSIFFQFTSDIKTYDWMNGIKQETIDEYTKVLKIFQGNPRALHQKVEIRFSSRTPDCSWEPTELTFSGRNDNGEWSRLFYICLDTHWKYIFVPSNEAFEVFCWHPLDVRKKIMAEYMKHK